MASGAKDTRRFDLFKLALEADGAVEVSNGTPMTVLLSSFLRIPPRFLRGSGSVKSDMSSVVWMSSVVSELMMFLDILSLVLF